MELTESVLGVQWELLDVVGSSGYGEFLGKPDESGSEDAEFSEVDKSEAGRSDAEKSVAEKSVAEKSGVEKSDAGKSEGDAVQDVAMGGE